MFTLMFSELSTLLLLRFLLVPHTVVVNVENYMRIFHVLEHVMVIEEVVEVTTLVLIFKELS